MAGLDGTVALITGASSGIGQATARALAANGAAVAVVARRKERLDELAAEIREKAGRALAIPADITDKQQANAAVDRTVAELGRLDMLVNNAGVAFFGPIVDAPTDEWEQMIALNVQGLLYCSRAALPHLLRAAVQEPRRVADMVNVSSIAGRNARSGTGVYNLTKFGVNAFSESLRQEVTSRHVRVSAIEPGVVDTELLSRAADSHAGSSLLEGIEEVLRPEDIADAITYIVTRPRHVAINEVLIRPTDEER